MKPKTADKNDQNVREYNLLLGIPEEKEKVRTQLVIDLAFLNRTDLSQIYIERIIANIPLTKKEKDLYYFECRNNGI